MRKLPDLEAWAIFATVASTGSFARAAEELSLSPATVSKAITRLEQRMKTMLFHRTSRSMSLTESGHVALDRANRILEEGEAVEAEITEQSQSLRGMIRVSAPMSFGLSSLAPLLPTFLKANPEVELDIQFNDEHVDLVAEGFDLAVRISNLVDSSLLARNICKIRILLVGAPAYLEAYGEPKHPMELAHHKALLYTYSKAGMSWRFQHPVKGEFVQHLPPVSLRANNSDGLQPALLAGMGLALLPDFLVWDHLQSGALRHVMQDWSAGSVSLSLVTPPGRKRPARVQAFMDYLASSLAKAPWVRAE